jgi:hypothetical protein
MRDQLYTLCVENADGNAEAGAPYVTRKDAPYLSSNRTPQRLVDHHQA